jgi:hypothetical protein
MASGSGPTAKKVCQAGGKFRASWKLSVGITASSKGSQYAHCKLCMSDFSVAHGGLNDITRHTKGPTHQRRFKDSSSTQGIASMVGQPSQLSHTRKVTSAEVVMSNFIAMHNLSFQSADHLSQLFTVMFPDSAIASDFSCKHTKTRAIICEALDPHHKMPVVENARKFPFSLLCDESNEKGDSVKLLTVLIRSYECERSSIATRHLHTVGITGMTAADIFESIEEVLVKYDLEFSNLIAFASDTCNVMKGVRNGVIAKIRQEQPKILDIHCICHVVSLCVKSAVKTLPIKVDEILVDVYYHFRNSVKSIASLREYADFCDVEFKLILKHCETRWLSLRRSIKRAIDMWEPLLSYFTSHPDVEKDGKVKFIYMNLSNPTIKLWMLFLHNTLAVFDKYNIFFQISKAATIHKLHSESERLLKTVLTFFVKASVIRGSTLTNIDYLDSDNQLTDDDVFIGDDTTAFLLNLTENEGLSANNFFVHVRLFYEAFVSKLISKFDFKSQIFRSFKFLDPSECQDLSLATFDNLSANIAINFDLASVKMEFREFSVDTDVAALNNGDALSFWLCVKSMVTALGSPKYENLPTLALQLLFIPASNADSKKKISERVFSLRLYPH